MIFDVVDYVSNINILGGEPFLCKNLEELIIFLGDNYGNYIGNLQIVTNATLKVSESLLKIIKKYHVEVRISDYTKRVSYDEKLKEFCNDLEKHQINYVIYTHDEWLDMGFPNESVDMDNSIEELYRHMIKCDPNCHTVSEGKLYYCSQGWVADQSGFFRLKEMDYLDLESINECNDKKERLRRCYFGDLEEGYFSFCKVCMGDTDITVQGGVQQNL